MDQLWVQALFWGAVSGGALVIGAAAGFLVRVPRSVVAAVMAFGSGVLISALSFELMQEAVEEAGLVSSAVGFVVGSALYAGANALLATRGAKERKRSGDLQPSEQDQSGSGAAIAVGALLDGIPESIAIGLSILHGGTVSIATVVAIFLSNLPEGLASSDGMRRAGRPASYVFGVWIAIAFACGLSSLAGFLAFDGVPPAVVAGTTALAAGAMLTMIVDTMIPESVEGTGSRAGIFAVMGFLVSFALSQASG